MMKCGVVQLLSQRLESYLGISRKLQTITALHECVKIVYETTDNLSKSQSRIYYHRDNLQPHRRNKKDINLLGGVLTRDCCLKRLFFMGE